MISVPASSRTTLISWIADSTSLQCEYVMIRVLGLVESGADLDIVDLEALDNSAV